jgi:hypothetical protein
MLLKSVFMLVESLLARMVIFGNPIQLDGDLETALIVKVMLLMDGKETA